MEELYHQIEQYLEGTLPLAERAAFEKQMAIDSDLAEEVEIQSLFATELGDVEKAALRDQLEEIGANFDLSHLEMDKEKEGMEEGFSADNDLFVVQNLDTFLQNIIKEALTKQTPPNPRLERKRLALVKSSVSIGVVQPKADDLCGEEVLFELDKASKQAVRLVLQNAKGKSVGVFRIPADEKSYSVSLVGAALFPSGVYYWTLILEGVPVVGRFFVCRGEDVEGMIN